MPEPQDSANDPWSATAARIATTAPTNVPEDPWAQTAAQLRPDTPAQSQDPWATTAERLTPAPKPTKADDNRFGEDEPWYNRPLSTRLGIPEYHEGASGIWRGVEKFASSLTSPLSLGLMLVTGGVGGIAEAGAADAAGVATEGLAGKFGASILGKLAPETAAAVGKAANTVTRLAAGGFSLQQIAGMSQQYPQLRDAIKSGDYDRAAEMATSMLLEGAGAAMTGAVAARGIHAPGEPALGHDKYITAAELRHIEIGGRQAQDFLDANKPLWKNTNTDIAALFYHNAGGDVSVLERAQAALKDNDKLTSQAKQRINSWLDTAKNLPDSYKQLSASLRPKYADLATELQELGKLHPDAKLPENYGGEHKYVFDQEGDSNLNFTGRRKPGFLKERTFGDIFEAINNGYEPNRGLASNYAAYTREMGQVRGLAAAIKEAQTRVADDGRPVAFNPNGGTTVDGKPALAVPPQIELALLKARLKMPGATMPELQAEVTQNAWIREATTEAGETIASAAKQGASPEVLAQLDRIKTKLGELANAKMKPEELTKAVFEQLRTMGDLHPRAINLGAEPSNSTALQYYDPATNKWSAEREAMHKSIVDRLISGLRYDPAAGAWIQGKAYTSTGTPTIDVLGGGTASGKTSAGRVLLAGRDNLIRIDPDEIKTLIPEYEALKQADPELAAARVHEESKAITQRLLAEATARKLDMVYDTTTSGGGRVQTFAGLKNKGYNIKTKFFDIPVEEAIRRAKLRATESNDPINRGRIVPESHIREAHGSAAKNFFRLKDISDDAKFYDNSGPKDSKPAIIYERGTEGKEIIHNAERLDEYRKKAGLSELGRPGDAQGRERVLSSAGRGGGQNSAGETEERVGKGLLIKNGKLYFDMSDYKPGPDSFGKFYKYQGTDKESGSRYFAKSNMLVHPEYRDALQKSFQDTSWFRNKPLLSTLLKGTSQAKQLLLSFSPFHWTTEYLRGITMGMNPIEALRPPPLTAESPAVTTKFGPMLGADSSARAMMQEGMTGVVSKIPVVGKLWEQASNHLFGDYIPRLKAASWERVVDQLSKRHTNWSEDQVHFAASKIVDAAYGGLNWRQLGVDMTSRDALRLIFLAPDFTGSQLLFAKSAFEPGGSIARNALMKITAYNFAAARVLNMLNTGSAHLEQPFGIVSEDGKKVYSMRTMPSDIAHALSDPRGFIAHRLSPTTKTAEELVSGRDEQGKRITGQQQVFNMLRNVMPISAQSLAPGLRREDETPSESVFRAAGFAPEPNRTAAEAQAMQIASDHSESGPVDSANIEKHQKMLKMEDDLRTGKATWEDLRAAYTAGEISKKDSDTIIKNARATKNMEPSVIRLYTRATRLQMKDFLKVWKIATPQEREVLDPLYQRKRQEYMKSAAKNLSPAGLAKDETYQKLRAAHPNEPPW